MVFHTAYSGLVFRLAIVYAVAFENSVGHSKQLINRQLVHRDLVPLLLPLLCCCFCEIELGAMSKVFFFVFTSGHLMGCQEDLVVLLQRLVVLCHDGVLAFETVELPGGGLPLLDPMSAIAGKLATQVAAQYIGRMYKGMGKLLGGIPGVPPATVVVVGGGVVGTNAASIALGLGARVILLDILISRLRYLGEILHGRFETLIANPYNIANAVKEADVVIGAVLVPGG